MKILHVSARSSTGGGPEMIRTLIQGSIDEASHWVACPPDGPYAEVFRRLLGPSRVLGFPLDPARVRPDLVHTHGFGAGLLRLPAFLRAVPAVHTFHGFYPAGTGPAGAALRLAAENLLSPLTRAAVAVSESEKRLAVRLCPFLARKTLVIANGIEPRPAPPPAPTAGQPVRVLAAGRLVRQKHPELALRIAAACRGLDPDLKIEFRLAGAGPLEAGLRRLIHSLGLSSTVQLLGDVRQIGPELASAHIYLSTARWEGLSLALLEAMHAGLACVATRVQGNVDAIEHERTGLLFNPASPDEAARQITALARDPATRRAYGLQAQAEAQARFSARAMCRQYLDLYRAVLAPAPGGVCPSCARWPS